MAACWCEHERARRRVVQHLRAECDAFDAALLEHLRSGRDRRHRLCGTLAVGSGLQDDLHVRHLFGRLSRIEGRHDRSVDHGRLRGQSADFQAAGDAHLGCAAQGGAQLDGGLRDLDARCGEMASRPARRKEHRADDSFRRGQSGDARSLARMRCLASGRSSCTALTMRAWMC